MCVVYCVLVCVSADKRRENCIAQREAALRAESALKIVVSFLALNWNSFVIQSLCFVYLHMPHLFIFIVHSYKTHQRCRPLER